MECPRLATSQRANTDAGPSANLGAQIDLAFRRRLVEVLREAEPATRQQSLRGLGMEWEMFANSPEHYPHLELLDILVALNTDDALPGTVLRFGMSRKVLDLGVLGYTVLCCRDLRQALEVLQRYHRLTDRAYSWRLNESEGSVSIRKWSRPGLFQRHLESDEECLTGIWAMLLELLPAETETRRVSLHLAHAAPVYRDLYRQYFPGDISFDRPYSELRFPDQWLNLPIQSAEDTLERACESQCERIMNSMAPGVSEVEDVRRLLLSRPSDQAYALVEVAERLHLSQRTLERRLHRAGTSFREINNEVRMSLAADYLEWGYLSTDEIGYLLGYGQSATFYRAFKNWFGITPGAYRKQHAAIAIRDA